MPGYRVAMWCSQPVPQHLVSELSPHRPHLFPTTVWTSSRPSSATGHVDATTYLVLKNRFLSTPPLHCSRGNGTYRLMIILWWRFFPSRL